MNFRSLRQFATGAAIACMAPIASAGLITSFGFVGNVGLSVDGVGSNLTPTGSVQAEIPVGATILKAYLYTAGVPSPFYPGAPTTVADYNSAGITLGGIAVTNYSKIVGAISDRVDIGRWYTGRADVTSLVSSLVTGSATSSFSWIVNEGGNTALIDGSVLAIAYEHSSMPQASVVFLDGGQSTGGETTNVGFAAPIGDPNAPGFLAQFGIASSFSCCDQASTISVNGSVLTRVAGNSDDGNTSAGFDGSLITVGGLGDDPANNVSSYSVDDELYNLVPFLATGATGLSITTFNATNDDNIFFAHLYTTARIGNINDTPIGTVSEPHTLSLVLGVAAFALVRRRRDRRQVR